MDTLPRIIVDFNRLGYETPNVIPLGTAASPGFAKQPLVDGMAALFYEPGEMEAQGILRQRTLSSGESEWEAVIDPTTLRYYYAVTSDGGIMHNTLEDGMNG